MIGESIIQTIDLHVLTHSFSHSFLSSFLPFFLSFCPFLHSFYSVIHLFTDSLNYLITSFICSFILLFVPSSLHPYTHLFIQLLKFEFFSLSRTMFLSRPFIFTANILQNLVYNFILPVLLVIVSS